MPPLPPDLATALHDAQRALRELYGNRLRAAVLFGSRARGDHEEDSDLDVAVFVRDYRYEDRAAVVHVASEFLGEEPVYLQAMAFEAERYDATSFLMRNIRTEGVTA